MNPLDALAWLGVAMVAVLVLAAIAALVLVVIEDYRNGESK